MQILSVVLKNFKAHGDRAFTFAPGTNAICGENGAGKTSILEAIAWVLFNYQGDYTRDDLIRNGSSSAEVAVEFISSADGRTYIAQRHTTKGYLLFDPQLNQRLPYSRLRDEVLPWLREHLGVSPGTDLGELFARTLGVPQGTFTADFLQATEARRAIFDKILKVDEYKTVHQQLNSLRRYAEALVEQVERDIASYDDRLQDWEPLHQRHQALVADIDRDQARLTALGDQIQTLAQTRSQLQTQAQTIQQLQAAVHQTQTQQAAARQQQTLLQQNLDQARQAADRCAQAEPGYQAYQAAEAALQALGAAQGERQALQKRQQQLQKTWDNRAADLTRLQVQLEGCEAAIADITALQPLVVQQGELETALAHLQQRQQALAQVQGTYDATGQQQRQLDQQLAALAANIDNLNALATQVEPLAPLEQQRDRLQQQIHRLEAARQFEAELQRLVGEGQGACDRHQTQATAALATLAEWQQTMPLLAAAIADVEAAIAAGVTVNQDLLAGVQGILADLQQQTDPATLNAQRQQVQQRIIQVQQQQARLATLPQLQTQVQALRQQRDQVQAQRDHLGQQLAAGADLAQERDRLTTALAALQDPRGRCAVLEKSRQQQPAIAQRYQAMQRAQGGIQAQLAEVATQLQAFANLDADLTRHHQTKQQHQGAYLQYLQSQQAAQDQPRLAQAVADGDATLAHLHQQGAEQQRQLQAAQASYDPQALAQVEATYQAVQSERDRLSGALPQQQQLQQELATQLATLSAIADKRTAALAEKKRRDRIKRFITFARKAYKEAGPRITERYVQQVSQEADRLFRELLDRPNVALTWGRDYDIQVQEGASPRRFVNLSGGEQMCAALAVRLALLKVLADIDIAFFDEPTTNMDRPRRQRLAEAIGRIKSFTQLFVISHDDTFETVTENVILVEREG
ncbi:MAG: SMC family ATPase [Cyanobacteria bacterium]|nr:SMC family ATPase [Cyanobacteriota bacterium]